MKNILIVVATCALLCGCLGITNGSDSIEPTPIGGHRLQGLKVAIVADYAFMGNNEPNKDVMFATIQDRLGEYLTIVTNPKRANALIYLWVKSKTRYDAAQGALCWYATVGTHAVRQETAQQYWRFQLATGDKYNGKSIAGSCNLVLSEEQARIESIEQTSAAVAEKIIDQIHQQNSIPSTSEYEIKFAYQNTREKTKFRETIKDLEDKLKILPGGSEAPGYLVYKIKILRKNMSHLEIADLIQGSAEHNELLINCINSSPGVLLFRSSDSF